MDPYRNLHPFNTDVARYYGNDGSCFDPYDDSGRANRNDQRPSGSVANYDHGRVERYPYQDQGRVGGVATHAQRQFEPRNGQGRVQRHVPCAEDDSFWDRVRRGDAPFQFQFEGSVYEDWGKPGDDVPKFSSMRDRMVVMKKALHDFGYPTWAFILNPSNRVSFAHTGRVLMETFEAFVSLRGGVARADIRQVKFLAKKTKKNFNWGSHTFLGPREKFFIVTPENKLCALEGLEKAFQVVLKYFEVPRQQPRAEQALSQPRYEQLQVARASRNAESDEAPRKKRSESSNSSYHDKKKAAEAGDTAAIEWMKERRKRNRESAKKSRANKKQREIVSTD